VTRIEGRHSLAGVGRSRDFSSLSTPEPFTVGDYVMHYAGLILERLDPVEAESILEALAATDALAQVETPI